MAASPATHHQGSLRGDGGQPGTNRRAAPSPSTDGRGTGSTGRKERLRHRPPGRRQAGRPGCLRRRAAVSQRYSAARKEPASSSGGGGPALTALCSALRSDRRAAASTQTAAVTAPLMWELPSCRSRSSGNESSWELRQFSFSAFKTASSKLIYSHFYPPPRTPIDAAAGAETGSQTPDTKLGNLLFDFHSQHFRS